LKVSPTFYTEGVFKPQVETIIREWQTVIDFEGRGVASLRKRYPLSIERTNRSNMVFFIENEV
jgi:Mor family transcriptional regulator